MYNPTLGRWMQQDPLGYADGMNAYEYLRGTPANWLDPLGTAVTTEISAGGANSDRPWDGAEWSFLGPEMFRPDAQQRWWRNKNPNGWTQLREPRVECECNPCFKCETTKQGDVTITALQPTGEYQVSCRVSIEARIRVRQGGGLNRRRRSTRPQDYELTAEGRRVYGHEQRHLMDYQQRLQEEADKVLQAQGPDAGACGTKDKCNEQKRKLEADLRRMARNFINAREPWSGGPDITHGPPGRAAPAPPGDMEEIEPDGAVGPWVP